VDLADEFPALAALVERRPGGQRRLPTGKAPDEGAGSAAATLAGLVPDESKPAADARAVSPDGAPEASGAGEGRSASADGADRPSPPDPEPPAAPPPPGGEGTLLPPAGKGPRRPTRYGLAIEFEERPESADLGRLVESTVLVNTAHPAYLRAVASRSEGYHAALTVGMALAAVAVEPAGTQGFLTAFLARWGEAIGRDRRRRQPRRPVSGS
jgi:hypothetical protein